MSDSRITENMMFDAIKMLSEGKEKPETCFLQFRDAFLAFGSQTPDNILAVDHITLIAMDGANGLATKFSQHLFQDIAWEMDNLAFPKQLAERLPGFSEKEWDAYLRITTMLFVLLTNMHSTKNTIT